MMCTAHRKARGHPVALNNQFLKRPLNIWKACAHHRNDLLIAVRPLQRLRTPRNEKHRLRRDQLPGNSSLAVFMKSVKRFIRSFFEPVSMMVSLLI